MVSIFPDAVEELNKLVLCRWVNNYGPDEVLCGTLEYVVEECNVKAFFDAHDAGKPFYISGMVAAM